ncbi:MAG: urate hydroxylase PuuD, partial [Pseudomonadota bacterium]
MYDLAILWSWMELVLRWSHVLAGIVWIGSSFYFIALDLGLRRGGPMPAGVSGEEWQVHGGGFYHVQKYQVAPEGMPEHLTWFMWESYTTWLTGAALLAVFYWAQAELYLIDPSVADLTTLQAILISAGSIVFGWIAYDWLCKSRFGEDNTRLMILLWALLVVMAWGYTQVFTGRAALLHLGAFTATIMSANVFFIIIPNQRIVVADLKAGRTPDAKYGVIAKQRSTHNNYLTLPVVFLMLSNHYPLAFATEYNWAIAGLIFLVGVLIRHYFNSVHAKKGEPHWTWAAAFVLMVAIAWLSTEPGVEREAVAPARFTEAPGFAAAADAVTTRCAVCHAVEPAWPTLHWPPKGVVLETPEDVAR